jgi:hypothetical protein
MKYLDLERKGKTCSPQRLIATIVNDAVEFAGLRNVLDTGPAFDGGNQAGTSPSRVPIAPG